MAQKFYSQGKVFESLAVLNEAAKEKGQDLKKLIFEKYNALGNVLKNSQEDTMYALHRGQRKMSKAAHQINKKIHVNPWPYLTIVGIGSFLTGMFLKGSKTK